MESEWFKTWFDSRYYHLLYNYRDENEAQAFIDRLLQLLNPSEGSRILDVACGKGRHSVYLASKGYEVTGIDLSVLSIQYAAQFENELLTFYSHDIRHPFRTNYYDYIFNFFTSFGYFETEHEHILTLRNIAAGLKKDGMFVLDFFNAAKILKELPTGRHHESEGVLFETKKYIDGDTIVKEIIIVDGEKKLKYKERVKAYQLDHLKMLFNVSGFEINHIFGSYALDKYDHDKSDRLIVVASKHDGAINF